MREVIATRARPVCIQSQSQQQLQQVSTFDWSLQLSCLQQKWTSQSESLTRADKLCMCMCSALVCAETAAYAERQRQAPLPHCPAIASRQARSYTAGQQCSCHCQPQNPCLPASSAPSSAATTQSADLQQRHAQLLVTPATHATCEAASEQKSFRPTCLLRTANCPLCLTPVHTLS